MGAILREANKAKLLAAAGFGAVFAALIIIARTPPATGYELSIYYAYPGFLWFLFIAGSACGIGILIHRAFSADKSRWWLAGLLLVIFSNSVFLGLPLFREYGFYPTGDSMIHIGYMKDIMATGYIGAGNFYPLIHVLGVNILDITGISYAAVTNLLFVFFTMMYLLNAYLLATIVASRRGQALLITAFASPLVFSYLHPIVHPATMSTFMVPLLLYFYHRRRVFPAEHRVPIAISVFLAVMLAFFHPITTIFVIGVFLALNLSRSLYRRMYRREGLAPPSNVVTVWDYAVPIVGLVGFIGVYFSHPFIVGRLRAVSEFFVYGMRTSVFDHRIGLLETAGITTAEAIELLTARYGAVLLYGLVGGIALLIVLRMVLSRKAPPDPLRFSYAAVFVFAVAASVFSLFGYTGEHEPERVARFFLIIAPFISGLVLYDLIVARHRFNLGRLQPGRNTLIGIVTICIVIASILSILNPYGSPRVVTQNFQVTRMEIVGTAWFSEHQNRDINAALRWPPHFRYYENFNFGVESRPFPGTRLDPQPIPSHFGYDEVNSIAEFYEFQHRYLLIPRVAVLFPMVLPEAARNQVPQYTAEAFAKLRADPAVAQIYANGEFEVWRVWGEDRR